MAVVIVAIAIFVQIDLAIAAIRGFLTIRSIIAAR
jgi:hypothetical protein